MRGYILLILASILLLLASDAVAAQMGRGSGGMGPGPGAGMGQMGHNMWEQGKSIRADNNMRGMGFMHSAGNAYGIYVTFNITDEGDVLYYTVASDSLFNITFDPFDFQSQTVRGRSSVTTLVGDNALVQLHDNPAGVINILPEEDITITFELADYVSVSQEDEYIQLESENVTGYVIGVGDIEFSLTDDELNIQAGPDSTVIFRAPPVNVPATYGFMHQGFAQGIAQNRIGMEVAFGDNETYDVVNYSRNMHLEVQEIMEERIRMQVDSTDPEGRVMSINLDNTSLELRERQRLRIHFDEQPLNCIEDPEAVLNSTGTGQPLCWVSPVQNRSATCLMYIPNFSVHTIELTTEEEMETPAETATTIPTAAEAPTTEAPGIPGFEIAGGIAALTAIALILFHRKY
ncbi:MAG: hypothetical protein R6U44_03395 [Archaeoglobaceae archaeon]